ncbi:MAG: hypothetical protein EGQ56_00240 [Clostridiales bacterium]|nr:hypothetical protein [Clostridiales bacterium]
MARSKKAKKRTSTALLLVLIALAVFIGIELIQVNQRLGEAKVQEASLTRQMQQQQQENEALRSDLAKKDDPDFIKELARDQLGLAEEGERIFYDVNE